jgi:hypothetical protein
VRTTDVRSGGRIGGWVIVGLCLVAIVPGCTTPEFEKADVLEPERSNTVELPSGECTFSWRGAPNTSEPNARNFTELQVSGPDGEAIEVRPLRITDGRYYDPYSYFTVFSADCSVPGLYTIAYRVEPGEWSQSGRLIVTSE